MIHSFRAWSNLKVLTTSDSLLVLNIKKKHLWSNKKLIFKQLVLTRIVKILCLIWRVNLVIFCIKDSTVKYEKKLCRFYRLFFDFCLLNEWKNTGKERCICYKNQGRGAINKRAQFYNFHELLLKTLQKLAKIFCCWEIKKSVIFQMILEVLKTTFSFISVKKSWIFEKIYGYPIE